nr:hypothetical protein [Deltaproteobacteria bacterium]
MVVTVFELRIESPPVRIARPALKDFTVDSSTLVDTPVRTPWSPHPVPRGWPSRRVATRGAEGSGAAMSRCRSLASRRHPSARSPCAAGPGGGGRGGGGRCASALGEARSAADTTVTIGAIATVLSALGLAVLGFVLWGISRAATY